MRYPPDHRQKTRERILDAASVVFRSAGYGAGSVDDVMKEAGLTAGGFYNHFESKEELFAETLLRTVRQSQTLHGQAVGPLQGPQRVRAIAARYLSPAHRRLVQQGCPLPPLLADLPRHNAQTRCAFEQVLSEYCASIVPHLTDEPDQAKPNQQVEPNQASDDQALAMLAVMVGGMSLARGVADEALGDRILAACRRLIDQSLAAGPELESKPVETKSAITKSAITKNSPRKTTRKKGQDRP